MDDRQERGQLLRLRGRPFPGRAPRFPVDDCRGEPQWKEVKIMLDFNSILVFSKDPKKLADFYKQVFQKDPDWSEAGYYGFMAGKGFITFGPHDKVKGRNANPERMMFNFETKDVKGEFARIKKLGAAVVAEPYNPAEDPKMMIATFADPDNNYFQLVTPMEIK
jgi:predicted enzyme related to lactoylglutathione lyase